MVQNLVQNPSGKNSKIFNALFLGQQLSNIKEQSVINIFWKFRGIHLQSHNSKDKNTRMQIYANELGGEVTSKGGEVT